MTTREILSEWFDEGIKKGATHLVVVVDQFDYEDYPVYVKPGEDVRKLVEEKYSGQNMQKMMEVYHLGRDKMMQIGRKRNYEY